jgi:hypothetical protein
MREQAMEGKQWESDWRGRGELVSEVENENMCAHDEPHQLVDIR